MPRQMQNKVKLTLSIDKNILERAKRKIPNLSAFLEIKLLEFLELGKATIAPPPEAYSLSPYPCHHLHPTLSFDMLGS